MDVSVLAPDVDDRGRRMCDALVSLGFSMHAECIGGETLFTSYANVGNPANWNLPTLPIYAPRPRARLGREKRLSPVERSLHDSLPIVENVLQEVASRRETYWHSSVIRAGKIISAAQTESLESRARSLA